MPIHVEPFLDHDTSTFTFVVHDLASNEAAVIDSVLNYDQFSGTTATTSADLVLDYVSKNNLKLMWILETHIHADHLTASRYIQQRRGGTLAIGSHIRDVLAWWIPIFNTTSDTPADGSQFDLLLNDGQTLPLGESTISIIHTPGHTPACLSYHIEQALFVGDTIFMPDIGTARTDFPGGSAAAMYDSVQKILSLPDETIIYHCHDYPPEGRSISCSSTVGEQKISNILIKSGISKEEYVATRNKRDEGKAVPKLLLPSIQVNMRGGSFGNPESNRQQYVKIPVDALKS